MQQVKPIPLCSDKLLSRKMVANLLQVSLSSLDALRNNHSRKFPAPVMSIRKIIRWREADVQAWLTKEISRSSTKS